MGMSEDDKRNCCLVEIHETEAKYYKTLEDIEKVSVTLSVHLYEHMQFTVSKYVYFGPGVGSVRVSFCHLYIVGVRACGLELSRKMSATGRFFGWHKCHRN